MCGSVDEESKVFLDAPSVAVQNVTKTYAIGRGRSEDASAIRLGRPKRTVEALKGVSFVAQPGETIGIIGLNGSGKSTLLRLIAGAEEPTSGQVLVRKKPMLLGVSPALHGDLTGAQNVYLGCLALGMPADRAKEQIKLIAEWTELGEAIDRPMSTYSSGMGSRLNFAISTAVEPDILLVDEALSTGDAAFGAKAKERINGVIERAGNLFLVSHSIGTVEGNGITGVSACQQAGRIAVLRLNNGNPSDEVLVFGVVTVYVYQQSFAIESFVSQFKRIG